jgi:Condensation domain
VTEALDQLSSSERRRLVQQLREHRRKTGEAPAQATIPCRDRGEPLALSFSQQRLWFLNRLDPGSSAYNIPSAVGLGGPLSPPILAATLAELVRRHEVLRTSFHEVQSRPVQIIAPTLEIPLPMIDLSALPDGLRQAEARCLVQAQNRQPFELERLPLLRASLLRLAEDDHIAAFTVHHIVSDGWSMGVLIREVGALYQALLEGKPSSLPELPIQYADFAAWQRGWLDGEALEGLIEYWRQRLAGAPPHLDLNEARPRREAPSLRGAARQRRFPASLLEQLHALGRRESSTLFMTLLAPLQALLHVHTGATDIVVGTDVAGRGRPETEELIGFFVNQLPLRTDLSGDPTLLELLRRVRETALAAYTHQDLPFDHLVNALAVKRSLQHAPVFQAKLVLQNAHQESLDLSGLTLRPVPLETNTAQIELHWSAVEAGGELWMTLTYSTDLYKAPVIDRLLDQYEAWLHAFAEKPDARLGEVAGELTQVEGAKRAERYQELKSMGLRKLRGMRRQAEDPAGQQGTEV